MGDSGRGDKNEAAGGEFDDELGLHEHEMAPFRVVVPPQPMYGTQPRRKVHTVYVGGGADLGAKIECGSSVNAAREVGAEPRAVA